MIYKPLLRKTIKDNFRFWLIMTIILTLLLVMMIVMGSNMESGGRPGPAANSNPSSIMEMFFSQFGIMIPMIFILITGHKLIASQVDSGALTYLMSQPVKRNQVSVTQVFVLVCSIISMLAIVSIAGTILIITTGIDISITSFLLLNLGLLLLHLAISGISFMASAIFNVSSKSLLVGTGIPIVFFLFNMLAGFSNLSEVMEMFRFLTIFTLFDTANILANSLNVIWQFSILVVISASCYVVGINYFKKKDLPL